MGSFAKCKEVEQLRYIVASAVKVGQNVATSGLSARRCDPRLHTPDIVIMSILTKARTNGSTLLLDHSTLVCNRLGGANVSNELFDYIQVRLDIRRPGKTIRNGWTTYGNSFSNSVSTTPAMGRLMCDYLDSGPGGGCIRFLVDAVPLRALDGFVSSFNRTAVA